jgi:hypothetical protein
VGQYKPGCCTALDDPLTPPTFRRSHRRVGPGRALSRVFDRSGGNRLLHRSMPDRCLPHHSEALHAGAACVRMDQRSTQRARLLLHRNVRVRWLSRGTARTQPERRHARLTGPACGSRSHSRSRL